MNTRKGLLLALGGFLLLGTNDAMAKTLAGDFPGPAVAALRYLFGATGLIVAVWISFGRAGFVCPRPWMQAGRGLAVAVATVGFFTGIQFIPLADATTLTFVSPAITAVLSAVLLRERASAAVWLAIAIAFAGVLVVLRPSASFDAARLLPLMAAFGTASLLFLNRATAGSAPAMVMQMLVAVMAAPMLLVAATVGHVSGLPALQVPVPDASILLRCALLACLGTASHTLIYLATVKAPAAVIAPMTYVQLLVAIVAGWLMFGDAPDMVTLAGAALIIGAGFILFHSQRAVPVDEARD